MHFDLTAKLFQALCDGDVGSIVGVRALAVVRSREYNGLSLAQQLFPNCFAHPQPKHNPFGRPHSIYQSTLKIERKHPLGVALLCQC
eukprot:2380513-Rhodomonas_salina.1